MKVIRTTNHFESIHGEFDYDEDDTRILTIKISRKDRNNVRLYENKTNYYTITPEEFRDCIRTGKLIIFTKK